MKKIKDKSSEKSVIKEKIKTVSKEASRTIPITLHEQFRDATQQNQRDEYGGDRIEDTATNAAIQAFRMASNIKLLQSHRSQISEQEEISEPELKTESPVFPEPEKESFDFSSSSQIDDSYVQELLSEPPQQKSVPQSDVSRTFETVQPEQSFRDLPSSETGRNLYFQHQQVSAVQQGVETVPQTAENRTIIPVPEERAVDISRRQPEIREFSAPRDISRTNAPKQPELSVRFRSDEQQTQQIKTREMYVKRQSEAFSQQNTVVSAVPRSDTGTHLPEQSVGFQQPQSQIKTREMYTKKHSSDSVKPNTEELSISPPDLPDTGRADLPELLVRSHQIKTRELYVKKHSPNPVEFNPEGFITSSSSTDLSGTDKTVLPKQLVKSHQIKTRERYVQTHSAKEQNTELLEVNHSGESTTSPELIKTKENYIRKNTPVAAPSNATSPKHSPKDIPDKKLSGAGSEQIIQGKEKLIQERKEQILSKQEIHNTVDIATTPDTESTLSDSNPDVFSESITQIFQEYISESHLMEPEERQVHQGRQEFIKQQKDKVFKAKWREAKKTVSQKAAEKGTAIPSDKPTIIQSKQSKKSEDGHAVHQLKLDKNPSEKSVTAPETPTGRNTTMRHKRAPALPDSPLKAASEPLRSPVKTRRKAFKSAERSAKYTVKTAEKKAAKTVIKTPGTITKVSNKTAPAVKHMVQENRIKRYAIKTSEQTKKVVQSVEKTLQKIEKVFTDAIQKMISYIAAGGSVAVIIIVIVSVFGAALMLGGSGSVQSELPVSEEVYAYQPYISQYAAQYGIPEYVSLIMAVMMQESGGQDSDPMQAAECSYNTRFPNVPNGITDPIYSIEIGVHELADALTAAGVESPADLEHIKLALQGYNYGPAYIT